MTEEQSAYVSYLIRIWREEKEEVWRASAQHPHTGERQGFASLEDLFDYLRHEVAVAPVPDADERQAEARCEKRGPASSVRDSSQKGDEPMNRCTELK